jgi:hypothetical protein
VIEKVVETWHRFLAGELPEALGGLLADDVVFYSPVVYTPQRGKDLTTMYLHAAAQTLPGDPAGGAFHYIKQVLAGDVAVLEFEPRRVAGDQVGPDTTVDGKYVNGIDIIRCDDTGRIVEFRVMIRPLQAINAVHARMRAMLASMQRSLHPDERSRTCRP